ncbi:hypothetical protein CAPTEDRAFT_78146, partial [Capitella teleta]
CDPEWSYDEIGGSCYLVDNETKLSWNDSRDHCVGLGGDLASITGLSDQKLILMWEMSDTSWWIGGSKLDESSGWTWSDGSPATYFNWGDGEPDRIDEDCIRIQTYYNGTWHDYSCILVSVFICKKQ